MLNEPLLQSQVPGFPCRRGKVRDVYDLGDTLAIVATDRISAFDWVMPTGIPDKGRHPHRDERLLVRLAERAAPPARHRPRATCRRRSSRPELAGRTMHVRRRRSCRSSASPAATSPAAGGRSTRPAAPSAAFRCRPGLQEASPLPEPIFTPGDEGRGRQARREHHASSGWRELVGADTAAELRDRTLDVYRRAAAHAESRGHHPRRHQARVGPAADGRTHPDRRGADAGQLAVLAEGHVPAGFVAAVVRQAVRPRLAGNDRLGQDQPAAGIAPGGGREDGRQVSRGAGEADRSEWEVSGIPGIRSSAYSALPSATTNMPTSDCQAPGVPSGACQCDPQPSRGGRSNPGMEAVWP